MDFIKRNMPVVILGGITLLIFVVIIIASQNASPVRPTLEQADENLLLTEDTIFIGNQDAPITLVEFSDFQCPACKSAFPIVKSLLDKYDGQVKLAYRNYPLPQHPQARIAARAALIANDYNKFESYHDTLFNNQNNLEREDLIKYAVRLDIPEQEFTEKLDSDLYEDRVQKDIDDANALGVNSTPTFFLNDQKVNLRSFSELESLIDDLVVQITGRSANSNNGERNIILDESGAVKVQEELNITEIDEQYGALEISITEEGFDPDETSVISGQQIIWTNNTENEVTLVQQDNKFTEFEGGVTIEAGATHTFRIYGDKSWIYTEELSGDIGLLTIKPAVKETISDSLENLNLNSSEN